MYVYVYIYIHIVWFIYINQITYLAIHQKLAQHCKLTVLQ